MTPIAFWVGNRASFRPDSATRTTGRPLRATAQALLAGIVLVAVLAGAACGSPRSAAGVLGKDVKPIDLTLPSTVLDLAVSREDVAKALSQGSRSYVQATSVFSFRRDNLLQATLQVSRFIPATKYQSPKFRDTLASGVGGVIPKKVHLGRDVVYLTAGNQQRISVWFRGRYLFVLATRDDFDQPRTLLRQALEITP